MSEETKRVFCKDCKNFLGRKQEIHVNGLWMRTVWERCKVATKDVDCIKGEVFNPSDARVLNASFNCPHWMPKGGERIRSGHEVPKTKPWWRFWS